MNQEMKRRGLASTSSTPGAGAGAPPGAMTEKKMERKTVEKLRRIKMRGLCFNLVSLVPSPQFPPEMLSLPDQVDQANNYIVQLRERVDQLKERKAKLIAQDRNQAKNATFLTDSRYPIVEIMDLGSSLEVILITRPEKNFMLFEVIGILEEEGAEVVGVTVTTVDNKVYHTLHAQVKVARVGVETSRIGGRLHELISGATSVGDT